MTKRQGIGRVLWVTYEIISFPIWAVIVFVVIVADAIGGRK